MKQEEFTAIVSEFRAWLNELNATVEIGLPAVEQLVAANGSAKPQELAWHLDKISNRIADVVGLSDAVRRAAGFDPAFAVYSDYQKLSEDGQAQVAALLAKLLDKQ